jgi:CBS domain-containing protein
MKVSERMSGDVRTVGAHESLERAAQIMWEHDCGCVPIVDHEQHLVGVITDRDICMGAYTQGGCLRDIPVHRCMSRAAHVCAPDDTLESAASRMGSQQVRRLPVVDGEGHVVGILALGDLARTIGTTRGGPQKQALGGEVARALSSISEPRREQQMEDVISRPDYSLRARTPANGESGVPRQTQPSTARADELRM